MYDDVWQVGELIMRHFLPILVCLKIHLFIKKIRDAFEDYGFFFALLVVDLVVDVFHNFYQLFF